MAAERRGSRVGVTALWAACVALVAAAPIVGGAGGAAPREVTPPDPASLGDVWGTLMAASPESPSLSQTRPEEADVIPAGDRVIQEDLLNAPVPDLCGHPAGTLEGGLLPGLESGVVWMFTTESGDIPGGRVAYGPLDGGPDVGAAVAVYCDRGGVAWPESVVIYGPGPEYLGHVTLSDLAPGRQRVEWISASRGIVTVRFTGTYAPDESGSRGRVDGTVEMRMVDGRLVVGEPEFVDERPTAEEAVRAATDGDSESLSAVATSDAAAELLRLVEETRATATTPPPDSPGATLPPAGPGTHVLPPGELGVGQCSSPLAGAPVGARASCLLVGADGVVAHLHLARLRFAVWQLVEVAPVPSDVVAG